MKKQIINNKEVNEVENYADFLKNSKREFEEMLAELEEEKKAFEESLKPNLKSIAEQIDDEFIDDLKDDFKELGEVLQEAAKDGTALILEFVDVVRKIAKELVD